MSERTVIHWFRRDLRLADNSALQAALHSGARVIPLFILDPAILNSPRTGLPRVALLLKALASLDTSLRRRGSRLLVQSGDPRTVLPQIAARWQADAVTYNRDMTPYARRRDAAVERALTVPAYGFADAVLQDPDHVLKRDGRPYTLYTPFAAQWRSLPPPAQPGAAPGPNSLFHPLDGEGDAGIPSLGDLGRADTIAVPDLSEESAERRLRAFSQEAIFEYAQARSTLVIDPFAPDARPASSGLSPALRLGMLSPRQAYWAGQAALDAAPSLAARTSVQMWIAELIWREFFSYTLYHFPQVGQGSYRAAYDALPWRDAPDDLAAWQEGRTGYPIVDAAMRQLNAIGWLPNRARMITASFLCKHLLIDWREGERYFMQRLLDGDPALNNGNWQWVAGTGTDAQPYFRIFNPVAQSEKYDPAGEYIRAWVPELRDLPARAIHQPWKLDAPPAGYPAPLVNHARARQRALDAYRAARRR